ncbi:MAG: DUF1428 domain-containing protein [Oligoflexus sp.]
MGKYIDGYILPLPKAKLNEYKKLAELSQKIWLEHGALEYKEWLAEDVKPGKLTSFPQSVDLKDDETVIFAYVVYESREQRDKINAQVMKDPRMNEVTPERVPFDGSRLIFGGFEAFVG